MPWKEQSMGSQNVLEDPEILTVLGLHLFSKNASVGVKDT